MFLSPLTFLLCLVTKFVSFDIVTNFGSVLAYFEVIRLLCGLVNCFADNYEICGMSCLQFFLVSLFVIFIFYVAHMEIWFFVSCHVN